MVRPSPGSGDSKRRRFRITVVLVSVALAAAGSVLLAVRASSAETIEPTLTLHVQGHPGALATGPNVLWAAVRGDSPKAPAEGRLLHLDLATGSRLPVFLGGEVTHLTHAGDRLVASVRHRSQLGQVATLDWRTGKVLMRHWFDRRVGPVVVRGDELWALQTRPGALRRLDAKTLESSRVLRLSSGRTLGLAAGGGYLWATAADAGEVLRIDPQTRSIKRARVGGFPVGIVVAGGKVWFADQAGGSVVRLDPSSLRRVGKPIPVGTRPTGLAAAAGSLFVTDDDGTVGRIDVALGQKIGLPIRIASSADDAAMSSIAAAGQSVWVSSFASSTLDRIDPTPGSAGVKTTVRFTHVNDDQQGDAVTDGSIAGRGRFTATGAISDQGRVVVRRTQKGPLITFRYLTSSSKGTITFAVEIDTNFGTSRWRVVTGTKLYKGLRGGGVERENRTYTVITLTGTAILPRDAASD